MGFFFVSFSVVAQTQDEINKEINIRAYDLAKDQVLPLSTDQIMGFLDDYMKTQKASVEGQKVYPDKRMRVVNIPLDPGAEIPTIYVSQGYVSTLSFVDAAGAGWPVIDVVSGGSFTITPPEQNGHILRISPNVRFGYGNLSVRLKGLNFPITLNIEVDDDFVDYRFDARVPMQGPNSQISIFQQSDIESAGNATLSSILEGVIPDGLQKIEIVSGELNNISIYQKGNSLFIRTDATLLSPRWKSSASIAEGVKVYTVEATPVLLFSKDGDIKKIKVKLLKEGA